MAGGLAERFATDPAFIRLGLVAATLYLAYANDRGAHPLVLVPYAALWALVPTTSRSALLVRIRDRDARRELVLIIAALSAGLLLLSRPSSIIVLGLGGLAVTLLHDRPPAESAESSGRGDQDIHTAPDWSPRGLLPRRPGSDQRLRRPRPEPALWPLSLGLLMVIAVVALATDQATDGRVDPRIVIDAALLAVGAVLALSAWRGRARITLVAVVLLVPLWIATSVPDVGRFAGQGNLTVRPTSVPTSTSPDIDPELSYEIGYGTVDIDLRDLPMTAGSSINVSIGVTAGRATVTVPAHARVRVDGSIGLGAFVIDARAHYLSDRHPAVNRRLARSYPALGTDCDDTSVPDYELAALAERAGLPTTDSNGNRHPSPEIAAAIGRAGYRQPTVQYVDQVDQFGAEGGGPAPDYDDQGNAMTTTSLAGPAVTTVTFWNVQLTRENYNLCRPLPPPSVPTTIVIKPTIGLGTLEIHRA